MGKNNTSLHKAKKAKNDEFYTMLTDIEKEISHYKDQLKGKKIYCNCDTNESNFVKFFQYHYEDYGLKGLRWTGIGEGGTFQENECWLDDCDIVVTNPPFSLFREYVDLLFKHNKKFLIIGNMNACTYGYFSPYLTGGKISIGYNKVNDFVQGKGPSCRWYTNLYVEKQGKLDLKETFSPEKYEKYVNYNAINCDRIKDIPFDYNGEIGVPTTILDYLESGALIRFTNGTFEVVGAFNDYKQKKEGYVLAETIDLGYKKWAGPLLPGKVKYARIIIKKKV